jgi:hypothetical protein
MTRYTATISHHSIARSRTVSVGDTLHAAKINATREFGDGYLDHTIIITDTTVSNPFEATAASRRVGHPHWSVWE